jgi:hypothetical protein
MNSVWSIDFYGIWFDQGVFNWEKEELLHFFILYPLILGIMIQSDSNLVLTSSNGFFPAAQASICRTKKPPIFDNTDFLGDKHCLAERFPD